MDLLTRFNLRSMPFTREIAVENRFNLPFIEEEIHHLKRTIEQRMSGALIAPAGTGKTLLLRTLKQNLPEARYRLHYFKVTDLSKRDMCREICTGIGAKPVSTYPSLVRSIQEYFLNDYNQDGVRPVLLVDEAHDFKEGVLSMFRILTNFKMDSQLVVSVIFAGQPPLKKILQKAGLEDLARRLSHCGELRLLSRDESVDYLKHRITVVGGKQIPYDERAIETLFEFSRGNIRALGQLGRKSLEIAHLKKCDVVNQNHVMSARSSLPF